MTFNVHLMVVGTPAEQDLIHMRRDDDDSSFVGYRTRCGILLQHRKSPRGYLTKMPATCLWCLGTP